MFCVTQTQLPSPGLLINIFIFSLLFRNADSCFLQRSLQVSVPHTIVVGDVISKVDIDRCQTKTFNLTSSDSDFALQTDGTIITSHTTTVPANGRVFFLHAADSNGQITVMNVYLVRMTNEVENNGLLRRSKRRWSPIPFNIIENDDGPYPKDVEQLASDSSSTNSVYYTISGPGVDENPIGLFTLDSNTGMLKVQRPVDREEFPKFIFHARVFDRYTHKETDLPLPVTVNVDDKNDNKPVFSGPLQFSVLEQSAPGTVVGQVMATDRDQPDTDHSKISYSLLTGSDLFSIHRQSGVITTLSPDLDREAKATHLVLVEIRDMDGAPNGLFSTGTATISLGDVNDNPPTFTKTSYNVKIMENVGEGLILRIPVEDRDLVNTPNWNSKFAITKGNENGNFRIERDPKTNDGLIYMAKPLDYEATKNVNLEVTAMNQANLTSKTASWVSVPVNVTVGDVDEGPEFVAPILRIPVKENTAIETVLGTYTATDPETNSGTGIKYYKVSDPASWISIDENNGQLKVANTIDRESPYVQNGTYNVTMKAVDASGKIGAGMVILEVVDVNDHIPQLPPAEMVVCDSGARGSTVVVAKDGDGPPFSSPFNFQLGDNNDGKWAVTTLNDTAATLTQTQDLPTGVYTVPLVVRDLQGMGEEQTVNIRLCRCRNGACLATQRSTSLGVWAVLAMLLALALLLLLCVVLALVCVTQSEKKELEDMGEGGGVLLKSNTEAPGEQLDSKLLLLPGSVIGDGRGSMNDMRLTESKNNLGGGLNSQQNVLQQSSSVFSSNVQNGFGGGQFNDSQYGGGQFVAGNELSLDNSRYLQFTDSTADQNWETHGRYLHQKLIHLGTVDEERYADDAKHVFGFEGVGSPAGSVGCCSDLGDQDNLDFLHSLGPKFRSLAEVCAKK